MCTERVTKLDAARRQIKEAVRLFFEQRDRVAVHTLASAAAQVLSDLLAAKKRRSPLRGAGLIREELRKDWLIAVKNAENFFKHGDRDPEEVLEFNAEQTEGTLFESTWMYYWLTNRQIYEGAVFQSWFELKHPDFLKESKEKTELMNLAARLEVTHDDLAAWAELLKARRPLPGHCLTTFD